MRKLKWFPLESSLSIRKLASKIESYPFGPDSPDGFLLTRVRDSYLEARFVQRTVIHEAGTDPFGNEFVYEDRVAFKETQFRISSAFPQLELSNPPRGNRAFINRLSEISGFSIAVGGLELDVAQWAESIRDHYADQFIVNVAQASGLEIEKGITAKLLLSGPVDVRPALSRFTEKKSSLLDRVHVQFAINREVIKIALFRNGTLAFLSPAPREIIANIRASIPRDKDN